MVVPNQDYPPIVFAYSENGIIKYVIAYSVNRRTYETGSSKELGGHMTSTEIED